MKKAASILQIITALAFLMAGFMKAYTPYDDLLNQMPWVEGFSPIQVQMISVLELLGALGLVLPLVIKSITNQLAVVSGLGLCLIMVGAVITHIIRMEFADAVAPLILGSLATYVAYYRREEMREKEE